LTDDVREAREAAIHWVAEPRDAVTGSPENFALRWQLSLENIADCVEDPAVPGYHELGPGSGRRACKEIIASHGHRSRI
jgi:hypothetical protein